VGEDKFQDLFFCSGAIAESHFSSGQANDYWAQHLNAGKSGANATTVPQNTSQIKMKFSFAAENPGIGYGRSTLSFVEICALATGFRPRFCPPINGKQHKSAALTNCRA